MYSVKNKWLLSLIGTTFASMFSGGFSPKRVLSSLLIIAQLAGSICFGLPATPCGQALSLDGYSLVFDDEFNGTSLDTSNWEYRCNGARRVGYNSPSEVSVSDGNLVIKGEYREDGEFGAGWYAGMIDLIKKYQYGYFEIRCICNKDQGYWSAFWLQAPHSYDPALSKGGIGGAEIDIFEAMSYADPFKRNSVQQTIYCAGMAGDTSGKMESCPLGSYKGNDIFNQYNTYGLEWDESGYSFYINGVETIRTSFGDGASQVPEELIVSLEMPDKLIYGKDYKTEYKVDYVKVYQKN